jgi:hypothetical protein
MMIYVDLARLETVKHGAELRRGEAELRRDEIGAELAKLDEEYANLKGLSSQIRKLAIKLSIKKLNEELKRL